MTKFRHKCDSKTNPKYGKTHPLYAEYPVELYQEHIRREYEVPEDAVWEEITTPIREAGVWKLVPTGRKRVVVVCPDCDESIVVVS